jgi:hypothetical protein
MSFTALNYIEDAAELYGDTDYDRVSIVSWIKYLNAALRTLILVRPDAKAVTESVLLVAGTKQTKPTDSLRLLDISRNMGTDGTTVGKIITPAARDHIDYSNLLWHAATGEAAIDNYSYDKNVPDIFYVTPPVSSSVDVYIEMSHSQLPTTITAPGDSLDVNDVFFEPLVQYMLYKAFSVDDEDVEFGKATQYLQNFFNLLQIEMTVSLADGPEPKE